MPSDIQERAQDYAVRAIRLVRHLNQQRDGVCWIIGKQYLRSATSIGANLVEAQSGESRADFIHKCSISLKEARECLYWLKLLLRAELITEKKISELVLETDEIIAILARIIINSKRNNVVKDKKTF